MKGIRLWAPRSHRHKPRVAFVAAGSGTGELGGAERFFIGVTEALEQAGLSVELISVASDEGSFDGILRSYVRFRELDLSGYDGVISSKAPSFAVRHPNHVCYLQHTMRVFYDMFDVEFPNAPETLKDQRKFIQMLDTALLRAPNTRRLLAIGQEVSDRLQKYNGMSAAGILHHPTSMTGLRGGRFEHFFLPGRLHRWKRVDLAIRAFRLTDVDAQLIITGTGEDAAVFQAAAEGDARIVFRGRVTDQELVDLYADSCAVLFVPQREDLGLITFEAFQASKPVITVSDSGEPANIVRDGQTGFVCAPTAEAIAERIEGLHRSPDLARRMGAQGRADVQSVSWTAVADGLVRALGLASPETVTARI
jgi:hypothetical protein